MRNAELERRNVPLLLFSQDYEPQCEREFAMVDDIHNRLVDNTDSGGDTGPGDGKPDPPKRPSINIESPAANAQLTGPREGHLQAVIVRVSNFSPTSVSVEVQQDTETYLFNATKSSGSDSEEPEEPSVRKWSAAVKFRHPGQAKLRAFSPNGVTSSVTTVTVLLNERGSISASLDNIQDSDPAVPAGGAKIKVPVLRAVIQIIVTIPSPTKQVEFSSSLDNFSTRTNLVRQADKTQWIAQWSIDGTRAPGAPILLIRDYDYFGEERQTRYSLTLVDFTPPQITVTEPTANILVLPENQDRMDVRVIGFVDDGGQSGYRPKSLTYTFGDKTVQIEPESSSGRFTFVLSSVTAGPKRLVVTARDNSDHIDRNGNLAELSHDFTVEKAYKPKTIDDLLSQRSYLADLIRFASSHVFFEEPSPASPLPLVSSTNLSQLFMPEAATGVGDFFGVVSDPGSAVGDRIVNELLPVVALLRARSNPEANQRALSSYLQSVYDALLLAHGTSYEELRSLPPKGTDGRRAIAVRLGLGLSELQSDDGLDLLVLPNVGNQDPEDWLSKVFGLPPTHHIISSHKGGTGSTLLNARMDYLARRWQLEDVQDDALRRPMIDPDLIDEADLNTTNTNAVGLWRLRSSELKSQWGPLRQATTVVQALKWTYPDQDVNTKLSDIENMELAGKSIADLLPPLGLTMPAFRQLRFYQKVEGQLSGREKEDLAHLLTQAWKLIDRYPEWLREERGLVLWPNSRNGGTFSSGHYKRDFLPWRGSAFERIRFEKLVTSRLGTFESLAVEHERATLDAQRSALPSFRDQLLGISDPSSSVMDDLTERLLADVAATGALTRSLIEHAILTLQRLIDGVRLKRFETGHPAARWTLRKLWKDENDEDSSLVHFDEEWNWMRSYDTWRAAKMTHLYPENRVFPDLRSETSDPYKLSTNFRDPFLKELRKLAPTVPDDTWLDNNTKGILAHEKEFFVPVAVGVMLERARKYQAALDWYRKIYDTRVNNPVLKEEENQPRRIRNDQRWTLDIDPHKNARRKEQGQTKFFNVYTRFLLARIITCLVGMADDEFGVGTDESRIRAQDLYLEAKQLLGLQDVVDLPPTDPDQAYLPNPVFTTLRDHVSASLRKLRRGLSYIGTPALTDGTRPSDGASSLSRPTSYRFRVLMERAKQLVSIAQNVEAQYLAAQEKGDLEGEKVTDRQGSARLADESVKLRDLQKTEAKHGVELAQRQRSRSQLLKDRYTDWIAKGANGHEEQQITSLWNAKTASDTLAGLDASITIGRNAQAMTSGVQSVMWWQWAIAGALDAQTIARGAAQMFANYDQTLAQVSGIRAAQERRTQEWELQRDLSGQDVLITQQQIDLAQDRAAIADKEHKIAKLQSDHATEMLKFLRAKFTSVEFYEWMTGVLAGIYAFLLRTATGVAFNAEGQLAFERQQASGGLIKQDYWILASQPGSKKAGAPDRRGITGSARLLQDITALEQYAFDSERRLLNLSQTFSLARLAPLEFEEFRGTGEINFATTLRLFDEGFPGHYLRLIKRVRVSVVALIPPTQGIRATLSTTGLSRVVTGDPSFPTLIIRQEPQTVALTSPTAATGVFELDSQSDLLFPFEGMGVDTNWTFELPRAANPIDYDTLFDVMLSIDYTALHSVELRDRVVKQLPNQLISDRPFSVKRDLPDVWYELANGTGSSATFTLPVSLRHFPPGLIAPYMNEVALSARTTDGQSCSFKAKLTITPPDATPREGGTIPSTRGIVSSRQSAGTSWHRNGNMDVIDNLPTLGTNNVEWQFEIFEIADQITGAPSGPPSILRQLREGAVEDILVVFTFSAQRPAWN